MITKFDKTTLQNLRRDLNAVLARYGKDEGLEIALGNIVFTESEFDAKINVKILGAQSRSIKILKSVMASMGLKESGQNGRKLVDYKSRNYAYPFIYEQNGKRFKCSTDMAKMYFKA